MNISKINYFQSQLDIAVKNRMPEKADYYRRRITEVTQNNESMQILRISKSKDTPADMLQSAIKIWNVRSHSVSTRHAFLASKGIPEHIILQGLAYIGNGKMVGDM